MNKSAQYNEIVEAKNENLLNVQLHNISLLTSVIVLYEARLMSFVIMKFVLCRNSN